MLRESVRGSIEGVLTSVLRACKKLFRGRIEGYLD